VPWRERTAPRLSAEYGFRIVAPPDTFIVTITLRPRAHCRADRELRTNTYYYQVGGYKVHEMIRQQSMGRYIGEREVKRTTRS